MPPWLQRMLHNLGLARPTGEEAARCGLLIGGPALEALKTGGRPRSPRWPAVRRAHLAKHPRCAACGRLSGAEVHHILPVSAPGGKAAELDPSNLLTMCDDSTRSCHFFLAHLLNWSAHDPDIARHAAEFRARLEASRRRQAPTS